MLEALSPLPPGVRWTLALGAGYTLGCVSGGYYLVRWKTGSDIRAQGSGGTGATNAGRQLGRSGFVVTVLFDGLKGTLAAALAWALALGGLGMFWSIAAAVAGHIWPAPLRFRGGKGVATFLGGLLVADAVLLLWLGAVFGPIWLVWRRFSFSGLLALVLLPGVAWYRGAEPATTAVLGLSVALILVAHRVNIRNEIARRRSGSRVPEAETQPASAPSHDRGTTDRL